MDRLDVYRCEVCGNLVEVLHVGGGELMCCGKPMTRLTLRSTDIGQEKHLPVIEDSEDGITIRIGEIPHPMTEEHLIEWVEVIGTDGSTRRIFLNSGDLPQVHISIKKEEVREVRVYCNLHGLWSKIL